MSFVTCHWHTCIMSCVTENQHATCYLTSTYNAIYYMHGGHWGEGHNHSLPPTPLVVQVCGRYPHKARKEPYPGVHRLLDHTRLHWCPPKILPRKKETCDAVYMINCEGGQEDWECHRFYVGEMWRTLKTQTQEHWWPSCTSSMEPQHLRVDGRPCH